jgi:hypothetical protein
MFSSARRRWLPVLPLLAFSLLGTEGCDEYGLGSPFLFFESPVFLQLSLAEGVEVELHVGGLVDLDTLEVTLDEEPLEMEDLEVAPGRSLFGIGEPKRVASVLPALEDGRHWLAASATLDFLFFELDLHAATAFDTADLERPDECEILSTAHCALPFPSSAFLEEAGDATETGLHMAFPEITIQGVSGPPLDPTPLARLDGFAPTVQILVHLEGVDPEASDASRLLPPTTPQSPPYVDLRTHDARSLDADSPTVLIDAETGEHILHWVEVDQTPAALADPSRQVLFIRPGIALVPGHRYVVALRHMKNASGETIEAEPVFAAFRDRRASTIEAVEARREAMEQVFRDLHRAGVGRHALQLAFDFTVRSERQLHERMLTMRDDALGWLAGLPADDTSHFGPIEVVDYGDCSDPGQLTWRKVGGSFDGPYYLTGNIDDFNQVSVLATDADGLPVRTGFFPFSWDLAVPCSVYRGEASAHPLLLGHGFLGDGAGMVNGFAGGAFFGADTPVGYVAGATDWRGLALGLTGPDALNILFNVIGTPATGNRFNTFETLPHRLQQGMVNTLVLSRMMKSGFFNRLEALQRVPGDPSSGVFEPANEMFYFGVSLGGIYGTMYAGLNQDTIRHNVDVPAMNFSLLEQRSTQFPVFLDLIKQVGLTDPMDLALLLGVQHELWVDAESAAYIRNITGTVDATLPDTPPKKMLVTVAWLDKQVSNQATNIFSRSMGIPNIVGSVQAGMPGLPDVAADAGSGSPGLDSAMQIYDTGFFDIFDPAQESVLPALANLIPSSKCDPHGTARLSIPASIEQLGTFLQPGGRIFNFCDGVCDAMTPEEMPSYSCDPLE